MSKKRLLILALLSPLALVIPACDFPTESNEETQVSSVQNVTAASMAGSVTLSLTAGAQKLEIGKTTTLSYSVTYVRSDTSEPLPTQIGLSTSLGNFGNAEGGPTTSTPALNFTDSSTCTSCKTDGTLSFYSGSTTGTANVVASIGSTTSPVSITIAKATALFINSLSPGFGAASGGTTVTISGQGFPADGDTLPRVTFGSIQAQIVSSSETAIVVNSPASPSEVSTGSTLVVDVAVDVAATDVTAAQTDTLKGAFTYTAGGSAPPKLPTIRLLRASTTNTNAGDNAGGYEVVILGTNFIDPVTVKVGSGSSVSTFSGVAIDSSLVTVVNGGQVTVSSWPAATQAQLNGSVDVLLQNDSSGLGTVAQSGFSYQSPDVVVNASPTSAIYYRASQTTVSITARGLDLDADATELDTTRYKLEIGGEEQCSPQSRCQVTGVSNGTYTLSVNPLTSVTLSSCADQTGPVMFTDLVTTETASGPTFSYEVDKPVISSLSGTTDSETGGGTLTISGTFSTTELDNGQVLINGQSASFTNTCSSSPGTCTLSVSVPAFTGSFDTASCMTSSGDTGTQNQDKQVDIEVLYQSTTCNATRSNAFTYQPTDSSCQVTTTAPTAGFSAVVSANNPLEVQFIDQSTGATSVDYFLGDGNTISCAEADLPCTQTFTYSTANIYTVTQQVRNSAGSDSTSQTVQVGEAPSASLSGPSTGTTDIAVTFFNNSTGIDDGTTCEWDWDDGTISSGCGQGIPPGLEHTYTAAGPYTIVLRVTNGLGNDSDTATITISDP